MAWHKFVPGGRYLTSTVVEKCRQHISNGSTANPNEKIRHVELIENCGEEYITFSPVGTGWGASPMNQNCWLTDKRTAIVTPTRVPRNL